MAAAPLPVGGAAAPAAPAAAAAVPGERGDLVQFGDYITLQRKDEQCLTAEWLGPACYPVVHSGGCASAVPAPQAAVAGPPGSSSTLPRMSGPLAADRTVFTFQPGGAAVQPAGGRAPVSGMGDAAADPTGGSCVSYGQTLTLLHVHTNRFLCCVDAGGGTGEYEAQLHRPKNMPALVDETGSVHRHQWRVMPRQGKGKEMDGELVRRHDQVFIVNVFCGLFLNLSPIPRHLSVWVNENDRAIRSIPLEPPTRELAVCATSGVDTRSPAPWSVIPYDMEAASHAGRMLRALDPVVVFHREAEGFVETGDPDCSGGDAAAESAEVWLDLRPPGKATYTVLELPHSSNALWSLEGADSTVGGGTFFGKYRCRLKHVRTARYLTFRIVETDMQRPRVQVTTTARPDDENSLLCFQPIDSASQAVEVSRTAWCRIQFAVSGRYLHSKTPSLDGADADLPPPSDAVLAGSKGRRLLDAVLKGFTEDVFAVRVSSPSEREAVLTVRQPLTVLRCFVAYWREAQRRPTGDAVRGGIEADALGHHARRLRMEALERQRDRAQQGDTITRGTAAVFRSLIRFLSNEPMRPKEDVASDPLPPPHLPLQRMLFESHVHSLLFDCLRGPLEAGVLLEDVTRHCPDARAAGAAARSLSPGTIASAASPGSGMTADQSGMGQPDALAEQLLQVYRVGFCLVGQMVRGSKQLAVRIRNQIPFMERQLRHDQLNIASALMQIIADNRQILADDEGLRPRQLEFFCYLIPQYGRSAKYLELLSACCVCETDAMPGNQTVIARCLGGPERDSEGHKLMDDGPLQHTGRPDRPCYVDSLRALYPLRKHSDRLHIKPYTTFPPSLPRRVAQFLRLYQIDMASREGAPPQGPLPVAEEDAEFSSSESSLSSADSEEDRAVASPSGRRRESSSEEEDIGADDSRVVDAMLSPRQTKLLYGSRVSRRRSRGASWGTVAAEYGENQQVPPAGQGCWVWLCELPTVHGCDKWRGDLTEVGLAAAAPPESLQWHRRWFTMSRGYLYFHSGKGGKLLRQLAVPEITAVDKGQDSAWAAPEHLRPHAVRCVLKSAPDARPSARRPRVVFCTEGMRERNEVLAELRRAVKAAESAIEDTKALSGDPIFSAGQSHGMDRRKTVSLHNQLKVMLRRQRANRAERLHGAARTGAAGGSLQLGPSVVIGQRHDTPLVNLSSWVRHHATPEEINYLLAQLRLCCSLCLGNNRAALSWLQRVLPRTVVAAGLSFPCDHRRAPCLRAAFADLAVHLWLRPPLPTDDRHGQLDKMAAMRQTEFVRSMQQTVRSSVLQKGPQRSAAVAGAREGERGGSKSPRSARVSAGEHQEAAALLRVFEQLISNALDCDLERGQTVCGNYTLAEIRELLKPLLKTLRAHRPRDQVSRRGQQQGGTPAVAGAGAEQPQQGHSVDRTQQPGGAERRLVGGRLSDEVQALLEAKLQVCRVFMQLFEDRRTCELVQNTFRRQSCGGESADAQPAADLGPGEASDELTRALLETALCQGNDVLYVISLRLIFRHLSNKFGREAERDMEAHKCLARVLLPCVLPQRRDPHCGAAAKESAAARGDLSGREELVLALFRLLDGSVTEDSAEFRRGSLRISGCRDPTVNGVYRLHWAKHHDRSCWVKKDGRDPVRWLHYSVSASQTEKHWVISPQLGGAKVLARTVASQPEGQWGESLLRCEVESGGVRDVVLAVMTTLTHLIDLNKDTQHTAHVQRMLDRLKLSPLVLQLIESRQEDIVEYSLQLMIAMMRNGNSQVQESLSRYFLSRNDEALFSTMWSRMIAAVKQIQELEKDRDANPDRLEKYAGTKLHHIHDVLRVLQLFSEGHNGTMQDYLRSQPDNVVSYNLVQETFTLLQTLLTVAPHDDFTLNIVEQAFVTMTEFCQGPCRGNQEQLIKGNIGAQLNCVLARGLEGASPLRMCQVRSAALVCVHAVLEALSHGDPFVEAVRRSLDRHTVQQVVAKCWEGRKSDGAAQGQPRAAGDAQARQNEPKQPSEGEVSLAVGFNVMILLKMLNVSDWLEGVPGFTYLEAMTGRIEICREGRLERVYFRIPSIVVNLSEETKDDLLRSVKRDTPTARISDFFDRTEGLILEIEYYNMLFNKPRDTAGQEVLRHCQAFLHRWSDRIEQALFGVAGVANLVLLAYAASPSADVLDEDQSYLPPTAALALRLLAAVQLCLSLCLASDFWVSRGPLIEFRQSARRAATTRRLQETNKSSREMLGWWNEDKVNNRPRDAQPPGSRSEADLLREARERTLRGDSQLSEIQQFLQSPPRWQQIAKVLRAETVFLFYIACVASALFAFSSPFWLAFHLLGVTTRSPTLHNVIGSVTSQGGTLLVTALLAAVIIWYFTILSFTLFRDKFGERDGEGSEVRHCDDLSSCFHYLLANAVRAGGGIGDLLSLHDWRDPFWLTAVRLGCDFSFFVIIQVILLNIMSGVIIDTFARSREQKESIEADIRGSCFICGIESTQFDRLTEGGFEVHVKSHHNMWNYIYFFLHLNKKDAVTYTGPESFVHQQRLAHDLSFFPLNKAIALEGRHHEDDLLHDLPQREEGVQVNLTTVQGKLRELHQAWQRHHTEHKMQVEVLCGSAVKALNDQEKLSSTQPQAAAAAAEQQAAEAAAHAAAAAGKDAVMNWRGVSAAHVRRMMLTRGKAVSFAELQPGMLVHLTPEGCLEDYEYFYGTVIGTEFVAAETKSKSKSGKSPLRKQAQPSSPSSPKDADEEEDASQGHACSDDDEDALFAMYQIGARVRHKSRGEGEVIAVVPDIEGVMRAHVYFDNGEMHRYQAGSLRKKVEVIQAPRRGVSRAAAPAVAPPPAPRAGSSLKERPAGDYYVVIRYRPRPQGTEGSAAEFHSPSSRALADARGAASPARRESGEGAAGRELPAVYDTGGGVVKSFPWKKKERQQWIDTPGTSIAGVRPGRHGARLRVLPPGSKPGSRELPYCPVTPELRRWLWQSLGSDAPDDAEAAARVSPLRRRVCPQSPRRCLPPPQRRSGVSPSRSQQPASPTGYVSPPLPPQSSPRGAGPAAPPPFSTLCGAASVGPVSPMRRSASAHGARRSGLAASMSPPGAAQAGA